MSTAIYPDKCSYYYAPHDNRCVYCDSGSMAIMNRPGLESSSYLWQCLNCHWYQIQDLKPPKEFDVSWADIVDAERPLGQAASVSWDDINRLIQEDADGEAREEYEYDPMCCDPYYEEAADVESFPNHYSVMRARSRTASLPGGTTVLPWEATFKARSEDGTEGREPTHPQPPPEEFKPARPYQLETGAATMKEENTKRRGRNHWENKRVIMIDTGAPVSLVNTSRNPPGIGSATHPEGTAHGSLDQAYMSPAFDFPKAMEEQRQILLEARLQTQHKLVDIKNRLQEAEAALGNHEATIRGDQNPADPGEEGTHVKVNLPLRTNTWGEDERAKPVFTYASHSSAGMEVEVKRRGNISADNEPYFKRARVCPAFTRPQLSWEQDKMED